MGGVNTSRWLVVLVRATALVLRTAVGHKEDVSKLVLLVRP